MKLEGNHIVITYQSILAVVLIGIGIWVALLIKSVILMVFVALILSLALEPIVDRLVERHIPRVVSVVLVVLTFTIMLGGLGYIALAPFSRQVSTLVVSFPGYIESVTNHPQAEKFAEQLDAAIWDGLSNTTGNLINATVGAVSGIVSALVVIVFTIYILIDFDNLRKTFINAFPRKRRKEIGKLMSNIEIRLGGWLRGQVFLMFIIGLFTYVGLLFLGVPYPLALAVIAGLLEVIPYIGPILSVVPAVLVAFAISPLLALGVIGLYILIQQSEASFIVPKVMQQFVGFNPLIIIIALMVGGKLLGVIGAILAIPFAIIFFEVAKYLLDLEQEQES